MRSSTPSAETSLREPFEELIELAPELRIARLAALDLTDETRVRLQAMLVFDEFVALVPGEREARMVAQDLPESERTLLHAMLKTDSRVSDSLRGGAAEVMSRLRDDDELGEQSLVGTRIGTFRLLALIGQGGSSSVFRAAREAGDGSQFVALKLLRTGLYSADAQRRFRREQAILAQLTHPNIASLIEGGVSSAGIPYIAMELVDGVPITKAADERGLNVEQRLAWFATLCRTIEAAHTALIIHRDLKPSNLFVTSDGNLKVLDFGIAKLIDDEDSGETRTRSIALTPGYAAPEQFDSAPLTTAVDVYALGVVLGELLTGRRLVGGRGASSMLGATADRAPLPLGLPPRSVLIRQLRGDLDAILASAIADDPHMRYRSAGALADDVERHLAGKPVRAHPPSRWYRTRKFVHRHRISMAVTALLAFAIVTSLGVVTWQARNIEREAQRANTIRDFLEDMFAPIENGLINDKQASVRDLLAIATDKLGKNATLGDAARIDLQLLFSRLNEQVNDPDQEQALVDQAASLAASKLAPDDPLRLDAEISRAYVLFGAGKLSEAEPLLRSLESRIGDGSVIHGPPLVRLYDGLAGIADAQGTHESAVAYERKALAERIAFFGDESQKAAIGYNNLAVSLGFSSGHLDDVIDAYRHAYRIDLARSGPDSSFSAIGRRNLSVAELLAGRLRAARADLLAVEPIFQAPPNNKRDVNVYYWQGRCSLANDIGDEKSDEACNHALRATQEIVSPDNVELNASTLRIRAQWDIDHGEFDAARRRVQQASELVAASGNSVLIGAEDYLSALLDLAAGDGANSARRFSDAIRNLGHYYPEHMRLNALALRALVCSQNAGLPPTSCPSDADSAARIELDAQTLRWHPRLLTADIALARIDLQRGHAAAAAERLRNAIEHTKAEVDANQIHRVEAQLWLIVAEGELGDCVRAKSDAATIETLLVGNGLNQHPALAAARSQLLQACARNR
jgi:serine/threonine protein kinase/tetratricopeptide (TPR) repeat protein